MKHKTVLVTGASRGIGREIALKFAKEGYHVVITCINSTAKLLELKEEIERFSVTCLTFIGNIGDYDSCVELFDLIENNYSGIDIVINNAGISHIGLLTDMSVEEWNQILATNLSSVFYCSKLCIPYMVHQKEGKIINISSIWGEVGASCEVAYATTKGGINAFTKSLAKELAPSNIQVNAIACGLIDTDMNGSLSELDLNDLIQEIPTGRAGKPEEVAQLVFQLTQGNEYLNGQIIALDGAWS